MARILPEKSFYLFGMGNRDKLIYKDGCLFFYPGYEALYKFDVVNEKIIPQEYTVLLDTAGGEVKIFENENGVYIHTPDFEKCLTASDIKLPDFSESPHRDLLRILHHEILINIVGGKPVPNFFVYKKPWYRDSAMMAMVLEHTENIHLISDWIRSIDTVYDQNNAGNNETDNIGQVMYLISLIDKPDHPMIEKCLSEAKKHMTDGTLGGTTDFAPHPVYQTKWLRFGLNALGMNSDLVKVPREKEGYADLFWFDDDYIDCDKEAKEKAFDEYYPYLSWARWHYYKSDIPKDALELNYPLTWESYASQADYNAIRPLSENYAENKFAAPHTWHAAEMFLYLIEK